MSAPTSRTISRPFGLAANFNTASSSSAPSAPPSTRPPMPQQGYVLQDSAEDTPHDIHPHAASYASQRALSPAQPSTPVRTLRQMTPDERTAWVQAHGPKAAYSRASAAQATASTGSSMTSGPVNYALADDEDTDSSQVQPYWDSLTASTTSAQTPSTTPSSPTVQGYNVGAPTQSTASAPAQVAAPALGSPLILRPSARTSSLAAPAPTRALPPVTVSSGSGMGATPELEIVISRANGQDITIRMFAPPMA